MRRVWEDRGTRLSGRSVDAGPQRAGERGALTVLFALLLPVILILSVVVIDVGNWWVHRRHLQTLVDAGALAAAPKFVGCSFQFGNPPAANVAIRDTALAYAGDPTRDPATKNLQVQEPGSVHVLLNSQRFWQPGDGMFGGPGLDYTWDIDGSATGGLNEGEPCSERSLDVKATDDDVPLLFGFLPFVADPKRRARIEVNQVVEQNGMLPWAVPEVEPAAVAALFVDEINGLVIGRQYLEKKDDVNLPFLEWKTSELDPNGSRIDLAFENTGVVILVSKVDPAPDLTGTSLTNICTGDPLISCYAGDGNEDGLTFIHGWNDENGTPEIPVVRDVSVLNVIGPARCEDLSAPYFLRTGDCELGLRAVLHFGDNPAFDPQTAEVKLFGTGCHRTQGCNMGYSGAGASDETIWETTQNARFADDFFGRATFSIRVTTTFPAGQTNQRTFTGVAHPYVAEPADLQGNQAPPGVGAGPVEYLKITTLDPPTLAPDPNSRNTGELPPPNPPGINPSFVVTVGLRAPFRIENALLPPVVLRVASPSGSQNQAFDCDKPFNFRTEIAEGCKTTYRENYGDWDEDGDKEWRDILCADYPNGAGLPPDTFYPSPVPDCVRVETGDKIGQFRQGIADRLMQPDCADNNWPEESTDLYDFYTKYDFANDPRYVSLIVTDYGTFQGAGSSSAVPVKYFAGFYITGWDKTSNNPPCADNEPHPWYSPGYRRSLDNGDVWGHFINVVIFSAAGSGSDDLCNFDEVGTCIIGLVE